MPTLAEITGQASAAPSARGQARIPSRRQQAVKDYERSEEMNRRVAEQLFSSPEVLQAVLRQIESSVRGKTLAELAQDPAYLEQLAAGQGQGALVRNLVGDVLAAGQAFLPTYADVLTAGAGKAAALMGAVPMAGPIVYHGTPHTFAPVPDNPLGAFDATKIGTGEGAQSYGHGIYLAENPSVAKNYQNTLRQQQPWIIDGKSYHGTTTRADATVGDYAANALGRFSGDKKAAIDWLKTGTPSEREAAQMLRKAKHVESNAGALYTVDLPDAIANRMLDWDKPIGQQPSSVKKAIEATKAMLPPNALDDLGGDLSLLYGKDTTVEQFLSTWEAIGGSPSAGEIALQRAGVPGVKYLDALSRDPSSNPTRNYVMFPGSEKYAKIVSRK